MSEHYVITLRREDCLSGIRLQSHPNLFYSYVYLYSNLTFRNLIIYAHTIV